MSFHPEVMTPAQQEVLRHLGAQPSVRPFYLGGGTALAIQLGHRMSVDFDWFTPDRWDDPMRLATDLRDSAIGFTDSATARSTLHGVVNGVKVSFFEYAYPMLGPLLEWPESSCRLASLEDLACMKLAAIADRGSVKDFIDLYALGAHGYSLRQMLNAYLRKYNMRDIGHILFGLTFFDDAENETFPKMLTPVEWPKVKRAISGWVSALR